MYILVLDTEYFTNSGILLRCKTILEHGMVSLLCDFLHSEVYNGDGEGVLHVFYNRCSEASSVVSFSTPRKCVLLCVTEEYCACVIDQFLLHTLPIACHVE